MRKVLIANRGEIACRIVRSCRALGLATVAVHSEADAEALHVELADEAVAIGPPKAAESYLRAERILEAAAATGADALHPGYGFLAENADFARAVVAAGLTWIGPRPETIEDMGDKERARLLAHGAGVPILPGSPRFGPDDLAGLAEAGGEVGFPLLVKAAAGGGGIGMRRVDAPAKLEEVVRTTQAMAAKAFGDGTVYLEKLVAPARHVEIQVFGFGDGRAIHLFERDCSIQRRFQKIVEESPAPGLAPEVRAQMAEAAVALAGQERYRGAGTIEFVVGPAQDFYFLEMNTRIQVEHPVTEMLTGVDLVAMQLRLARGDDLHAEFDQAAIVPKGHVLECRIYAERPEMNFLPAPGKLARFEPPEADPDLRIDSGFRTGDTVTFHYDPLLAKLIVRGGDRAAALARAAKALAGFTVEGVHTNIAFLARLMRHAPFARGEVATNYVETHLDELNRTGRSPAGREGGTRGMIYDEPKFLPGGDRFVLVEFGNEMNLELNFLAQGLGTAMGDTVDGVVETAPCFASLLVHYEPDKISRQDLQKELLRLIDTLGPSEDLELDSRLFYLPAVYCDPWTKACVEDYSAKITKKEWDPVFVARINGLDGPEQLTRVHSGTEYWVASLGFWPGLPFMMALDPRCVITAPKYNPPRTWTPQGTIGMGGASTAIYPVATPGGYQIFARTPVPIWDTEKRFPVFEDSICLFRAGDRVKFVPVTVEEFEFYEAQVKDGTYIYNVNEYQKFSVGNYKTWLTKFDASARF